jgi:hypothetical protein
MQHPNRWVLPCIAYFEQVDLCRSVGVGVQDLNKRPDHMLLSRAMKVLAVRHGRFPLDTT